MTTPKKTSVWLTLRVKIYNGYGNALRFILKPALAPLVKELYDQQARIAAAMMDYNHYYVDDQGYVKERAFEEDKKLK